MTLSTVAPGPNPGGPLPAPPLVVTLGCRLNALESEVIRRNCDDAGLADTVIVNTCAVTTEAVRQARQTIRRLRRQHPAKRIIVTGCAAQLVPDMFARMPEVDRVLGNAEKLDHRLLGNGEHGVAVGDIMALRETAGHLLDGFEGRARAFVQVQQGCDHRCTFCIIPFARGPNRSVDTERIVAAVARLVEGGHGEVVLTGVDICSYGMDLAARPTLGRLVRTILLQVPALPRLRLSSLDPAAVDDDLVAAFASEPRLMPHVHLSLQAADDLVLKRMKRRHRCADVARLVDRLRCARPDIVFGADLIAGFPTETDAMFANTLAAIGGLGLTWLHVFPFSPREGTPAARMPQVSPALRRERARLLREEGDRARAAYLASRIGERTDVLVETDGIGRCPYYAPVRLGRRLSPGTVASVTVTGADGDGLDARCGEGGAR
ncbi:MAG: tRNA (N(6)-L-threonylcarbamoyladenosine(37)-C(2))-methylthiotransferase MtaB [Rhodospirillales bacterium]